MCNISKVRLPYNGDEHLANQTSTFLSAGSQVACEYTVAGRMGGACEVVLCNDRITHVWRTLIKVHIKVHIAPWESQNLNIPFAMPVNSYNFELQTSRTCYRHNPEVSSARPSYPYPIHTPSPPEL